MNVVELEDLTGGPQILAANDQKADDLNLYVFALVAMIIGFRIVGLLGLFHHSAR